MIKLSRIIFIPILALMTLVGFLTAGQSKMNSSSYIESAEIKKMNSDISFTKINNMHDSHNFRILIDLTKCSKNNLDVLLNGVRQSINIDATKIIDLFPILPRNELVINSACSTPDGYLLEANGNTNSGHDMQFVTNLHPNNIYKFEANSTFSERNNYDFRELFSAIDKVESQFTSQEIFSNIVETVHTRNSTMFYFMAKPSRGSRVFNDFPRQHLKFYKIKSPTGAPRLFMLTNFKENISEMLDAIIFVELSSKMIPWVRVGYSDAKKISLIPPKWR